MEIRDRTMRLMILRRTGDRIATDQLLPGANLFFDHLASFGHVTRVTSTTASMTFDITPIISL